jgi:hypothetical protein
MICILYDEPNCVRFKDAWVLVVHNVVSRCFIFNSLTILSHFLQKALEKDNKPNFEILATIYMASYLLDNICDNNPFVGKHWFWNIAGNPVHVYYQSLWENKYKKNCAKICDDFFAHIYKLLFCKTCSKVIKRCNFFAW